MVFWRSEGGKVQRFISRKREAFKEVGAVRAAYIFQVHGMTINYMLAVFFENQTGQGGRKTMCDAALF